MGSRAVTLAVALMCSVGLFLGMMGGGGSLLTTQLGLIGGAFFLVPPASETGETSYPKGLVEEKEPVMATKVPILGFPTAAPGSGGHGLAAINRTVITVTFPYGGEQVRLVQPVDVGANDTVQVNVYKDAPFETERAFKTMKERIDKILKQLKGKPVNPFTSKAWADSHPSESSSSSRADAVPAGRTAATTAGTTSAGKAAATTAAG